MSAEPLPCPFCGSPAKWMHHSEYTHGYGDEPRRVYKWQSSLHCAGCRLPHCSGFGTVEWEGGNALAQQYAMRRAVEQWNRRATPPQATLPASEAMDKRLQHAKTNADVAAQFLMDAYAKRPETWLGYYDDALVHIDTVRKDLDAMLLTATRAQPQADGAKPDK